MTIRGRVIAVIGVFTLASASPNDSSLSGHCVCPNCRAWDAPSGETVSLYARGGKVRLKLETFDVTDLG